MLKTTNYITNCIFLPFLINGLTIIIFFYVLFLFVKKIAINFII